VVLGWKEGVTEISGESHAAAGASSELPRGIDSPGGSHRPSGSSCALPRRRHIGPTARRRFPRPFTRNVYKGGGVGLCGWCDRHFG
jgi:hypothetical protein